MDDETVQVSSNEENASKKQSSSQESTTTNSCEMASSDCTQQQHTNNVTSVNHKMSNHCVDELVKDDSGIDVEGSPDHHNNCVKESSLRELSTIQSSPRDRDLTENCPDSKNVLAAIAEQSNPSMDDKSDDDTAMESGGDEPLNLTLNKNSSSVSDVDEMTSHTEEDGDEEDEEENFHYLHQLQGRILQSEMSDEEEEEEDVAEKKEDDEASDDDNEEDPVADKWHALMEIRQREVGYSHWLPTERILPRRATGSVNMVRRLQIQSKLRKHDGCVNCLNFNRSGTLLASGSDDLNIVLWNWSENRPFLSFDSGHRSNVFQAKFMPYCGDTHIVSCARDGHVRLAELSSTGVCKNTRKLAQHRGSANKLALLYDSSHVFYSCGEDAVIMEIDLRQHRPNKLCIAKDRDSKVELYSINAHPFKSNEFCVGGRDHYIRIYDKRMIGENDGTLKKFCPHHLVESDVKANVTCAVYNYNGTEVIGTYNDEDIYMFDTSHSDGADSVHRYHGHRNNATVKGVNFYGPNSEFIVSGSDCGNVFIWEKKSERIVNYFHADVGGVINVLEPHPNSAILATSGLDHDVKIWSPTAKPTHLNGLKKVIRRNGEEREEERSQEPEMLDGPMLWLLMQRLRRTSRRQARREGDDISSTSSDSDSEESDDGGEDLRDRMQCIQS